MSDDALRQLASAAALALVTSLAANRATKHGWRGEVVAVAVVFSFLVVAGVLQIPTPQSAWIPWAMVAVGLLGWLLVLWRMEWIPRRRARGAAAPAVASVPGAAVTESAAPQLDWSPLSPALPPVEMPTQRKWSLEELRLQMRRPLYCYDGSGQFLAELMFYSPVPFPPNSKLKALFVEARARGVVIGQYRYTGSVGMVGSNVRIGKVLVPIKDDLFQMHKRAEAASHSGNWEVEIDVRVNCELVVPGLADPGPHDFFADAQFCGVRYAFDQAELKNVLPKDLT